MPSFYTRRGDDGTTGWLGSERLPKHHPRIEALGAVDEANAALGLARALTHRPQTAALIQEVQRDLYHLMSELAASPETAERFRTLTEARLQWLESQIDDLTRSIRLPHEFITPGDSVAGAALDLARVAVRRAERRVVALWHANEMDNPLLLRYLNRLSSLCFALELAEIQEEK